jgi:translation initiation factor IF-2
MNLDKLEESILVLAEMMDLKANPSTSASGSVIESKVDKYKGPVTTLLVQRGTLKQGDIIVAGTAVGKVKKMLDDKAHEVAKASPSTPVEILGLDLAPRAGDHFSVVESEKIARDIADYRAHKAKMDKEASKAKLSLDDLFSKASGTLKVKELNIIIKGDTQGSVEAIVASLEKIINQEVKVRVIHSAVGGITESDVTLAEASKAIILGFNTRPTNAAALLADRSKIDIRFYSIIYQLIDDIKDALTGMLSPIRREVYIGSVEIRQVFNITKTGKVAGSYVTKGIIKRGAGVRLIRDDIVIHQGTLKTLRRFKDDVKEVRENYECGIAFDNYEDIREGDKVEVYEIVEEKGKL